MFTTTYDAAGNVTGISDNQQQYAYTYDADNRLHCTVDNSGTPDVPEVILTYTYDAVGNRTSLSDSLGRRGQLHLRRRNELTSETQSGTGVDPELDRFHLRQRRQHDRPDPLLRHGRRRRGDVDVVHLRQRQQPDRASATSSRTAPWSPPTPTPSTPPTA